MGQNLVPNGDFEQFIGCPTNYGQINSATYWINPANASGLGGTSDYFNQCGVGFMGVPNNAEGFQLAHSGGAYGGIVLYQLFNTWHEFIEIFLTSPLISNTCYHFEMFVNAADSSYYNSPSIGIYFSDTLIAGVNNALPLPFIPQINNDTTNTFDSSNWISVSGTYMAQGGENYLIIGNFQSDANTILYVNNANNLEPFRRAYVYIDDVSLTPCITGFDGQSTKEELNIYPNPLKDKLNVVVNNKDLSEIILYDFASRKILQEKFTNSVALITEQLAKGIYLYEVRNKNGVIKKGKVLKD